MTAGLEPDAIDFTAFRGRKVPLRSARRDRFVGERAWPNSTTLQFQKSSLSLFGVCLTSTN